MIVVDASVVVDLVLKTTPISAAIAERFLVAGGDVHAPHLLDAEVGQVIRRGLLRGALDGVRAYQAVELLQDLPILRYPHGPLLGRALYLRENATVYDGLYIALAETLEAPLVTRDAAMARVPGHSAVIEVVGAAN